MDRNRVPEWYVARVPASEESRVSDLLRFRGYASYAPRYTRLLVHKRSKRKITRSFLLFPGYLFVYFDTQYDWEDVVRRSPVTGVLGFDGVPRPLSASVIEQLRREEEGGKHNPPSGRLRPGEQVTVDVYGQTVAAKVVRQNASGVVKLVSDFLGRSVTIEREVHQVARVAA